MAKKAKGSKPKKTKSTDILMALRVVVLALIIISLLLPWYYDKASRGNTSVEATWYLLSYKVVSRNATLQIHTYSYDDVKPSIPNTVNVWNNTFILMVLALAAWLISLICSYLVKLKYIGNRWSIGVELIAFLIILAPAPYFYIYYPSAVATDASEVVNGSNIYITQHLGIEAFQAALSGGLGGWGPSYGYFCMLAAGIITLLILEERFRFGIGGVLDRMIEYRKSAKKG